MVTDVEQMLKIAMMIVIASGPGPKTTPPSGAQHRLSAGASLLTKTQLLHLHSCQLGIIMEMLVAKGHKIAMLPVIADGAGLKMILPNGVHPMPDADANIELPLLKNYLYFYDF